MSGCEVSNSVLGLRTELALAGPALSEVVKGCGFTIKSTSRIITGRAATVSGGDHVQVETCSVRVSIVFLLHPVPAFLQLHAKDKKKQSLPRRRIAGANESWWSIHPDAGEASDPAPWLIEMPWMKWKAPLDNGAGSTWSWMRNPRSDHRSSKGKSRAGPSSAHSPAGQSARHLSSPAFQTPALVIGQQRAVLQTCLSLLPVIWGTGARSSGLRSFRPTILLKCIGAGRVSAGYVAGLALYRERLAECATRQSGRGIPQGYRRIRKTEQAQTLNWAAPQRP